MTNAQPAPSPEFWDDDESGVFVRVPLGEFKRARTGSSQAARLIRLMVETSVDPVLNAPDIESAIAQMKKLLPQFRSFFIAFVQLHVSTTQDGCSRSEDTGSADLYDAELLETVALLGGEEARFELEFVTGVLKNALSIVAKIISMPAIEGEHKQLDARLSQAHVHGGAEFMYGICLLFCMDRDRNVELNKGLLPYVLGMARQGALRAHATADEALELRVRDRDNGPHRPNECDGGAVSTWMIELADSNVMLHD